MWQINPARMSLNLAFIELVLPQWGLKGEPLYVEDLGGAFNANWRVQLHHDEIVLRIRPVWLSPQRLQDVHTVQKRLNEKALKTPRLRVSVSGRTYEFVRGRLVEVYDYLPESEKRHWSAQRWQAGFAHMAQLHTALETLKMEPIPPQVSNYAPPSMLRLLLKHTAEQISALEDSSARKEALAICQEAERVRQLIETRLIPLRPHLPHQLVHGDFHLDNLLFDGTEAVAYTLDFDFTAWRERIFEVAYALRAALPQLTDNPQCILDGSMIRAWLQSYDEQTPKPLTPAEKEALPYQLATAALYFIAEACRSADPLAQVLREAPYLELAGYLVDYPDFFWESCQR